jgi:hypothetical protein
MDPVTPRAIRSRISHAAVRAKPHCAHMPERLSPRPAQRRKLRVPTKRRITCDSHSSITATAKSGPAVTDVEKYGDRDEPRAVDAAVYGSPGTGDSEGDTPG